LIDLEEMIFKNWYWTSSIRWSLPEKR